MSMGAITMTRRGKPTLGTPKARVDGPTAEQRAKGHWSRRFTMHVESATEAMTHVSRHDPVERWKALSKLEAGQIAAIDHCRRLWRLTEDRQFEKLCATYGERVPGTGSREIAILTQAEAREDLYRIVGYIPTTYWQLFENIVRFGEKAEDAGKRLNFGTRSAADRAHQTVCFVADIIAMKEGL